MPRTPLKVCKKRDGKVTWVDKVYVCRLCGETVAGGPASHTYSIDGKEEYTCPKCLFKVFHIDIDKNQILNDYLKEKK